MSIDRAQGVPPLPAIAEANRVFAVVFMLVLAGLAGLFVASPAARPWLAREGGLTEALTAATLGGAILLGIWGMRRTPSAPRCYWLVPVVGLIGIVDEIGLGAGLLGQAPIRVGDVTVNGLGDLLAAGVDVATTILGLSPLDLVAIAGAGLALTAAYLSRRGRGARALAWLKDHPPGTLLTLTVVAAAAAAVLDLVGGPRRLTFLGEVLELIGAGLLVLAALQIPRPNPSLQGWRPRMAAWAPDHRNPRSPAGTPGSDGPRA